MLVKDILARKPSGKIITISAKSKVHQAAELLSEHRIGALIVKSEDGPIDGILSERDIVREIGRRGTTCLEDNVSDIMTKKVQSCSSASSIPSVMETMTKGRFRHLPVVDDGKLIGVLSIGDIVAARIDQVEVENAAMAEMIAGNI